MLDAEIDEIVDAGSRPQTHKRPHNRNNWKSDERCSAVASSAIALIADRTPYDVWY